MELDFKGTEFEVVRRVEERLLASSPGISRRLRELMQREDVRSSKVTVRTETVRCGKGCSKCPHGPYLYAYWKQNGKTRSKYLGKVGK